MPKQKKEVGRKGLGRGLGSLLSDRDSSEKQPEKQEVKKSKAASESAPAAAPKEAPAVPPEARIWQIPIDKLNPNEYQPRKNFRPEALAELAASIKEQGILQPITARRHINGTFEIIAGERRWRAAQQAGLHEVPVILKAKDDQSSLELALIENIQREELGPIEEAVAYKRLADEFSLTQQQIAEKVGKDRVTVANSIRLLNLPDSVQQLMNTRDLSAGHAKVLLSLEDPKDQIKLAQKVREEKLSVRALELQITRLKNLKKAGATATATGPDVSQALVRDLTDELKKILGTKVKIDYADSKGKLSIFFHSDDALSEVVEKIRKGCHR